MDGSIAYRSAHACRAGVCGWVGSSPHGVRVSTDRGSWAALSVTFFADARASSRIEQIIQLDELALLIRSKSASLKGQLPWLKLAQFGDRRTEKDSLRHDANVLAITGIEADCDGEQIPFEQAMETLRCVGLLALVYTSPSHRPDAPRWRVLCPTSRDLPPGERAHLVSRLNGVFGGIFSVESWTLSQAYYFGSVAGNPAHRVELIDGAPIDLRDDLDAGALGKPGSRPAAAREAVRPEAHINEAALIEEIATAESYHVPCVRLSGKWAWNGVPLEESRRRLQQAMEQVPVAQRDDRWRARYDDVGRCLTDIYGKEAAARVAVETPDDTSLVSEDSVALAFASRHADELRFCHHTGKWFRWTGSIWRRDETQLGLSMARDLARACAAPLDTKLRKGAGRAAFAAGVERLAQADRSLAVTSAVWDQDPWLLGTPDGTVDLRTGMLRRSVPEVYITRSTAVGPALTADCPTWLAFLDQATGGDADLIRFLQRWLGYCLTGLTREHALLFVFGPGGNGKSVLLNTARGILGSYATVASMEAFSAAKSERHPADLAMLHGARYVIATETEEGRAWAEARIKTLTGGDPVTARFMRRDFFTFTPAFKLNVSGNHKPALRNVDDAARRRINVVPFMHRPEQPDTELAEKLRAEWPAILRWMIEGCLEWQAVGLQRPQVVVDATAEYFAQQDYFGRWLAECCTLDPALSAKPSQLLKSFQTWCQRNGELVVDNSKLRGMIERTPGLRYVIEANVKVAQSLFQMATTGKNVAAAIFWMKARASWRDRPEHSIQSNVQLGVISAVPLTEEQWEAKHGPDADNGNMVVVRAPRRVG